MHNYQIFSEGTLKGSAVFSLILPLTSACSFLPLFSSPTSYSLSPSSQGRWSSNTPPRERFRVTILKFQFYASVVIVTRYSQFCSWSANPLSFLTQRLFLSWHKYFREERLYSPSHSHTHRSPYYWEILSLIGTGKIFF